MPDFMEFDTKAHKIEELIKVIHRAEEFANSYPAALAELQRRSAYIENLKKQLAESQNIFDQLIRAEQTKRHVFQQNYTNPYLTPMIPSLADTDVTQLPRPLVVAKEKDMTFYTLPQQPKPVQALKDQTRFTHNWRQHVEKENAELAETKRKLTQTYEKTKAQVPPSSVQYISSLQQKINELTSEIQKMEQSDSRNQENVKLLERDIMDQRGRNLRALENIKKEEAKQQMLPQIKQKQAELSQIQQVLLSKVDPKFIESLVNVGLDVERAKLVALYSQTTDMATAINWHFQNQDLNSLDFEKLAQALSS